MKSVLFTLLPALILTKRLLRTQLLTLGKITFSALEVESPEDDPHAAWLEVLPLLVANGIAVAIQVVGTSVLAFSETPLGRTLLLMQLVNSNLLFHIHCVIANMRDSISISSILPYSIRAVLLSN